jgi:hypothetical protein
MTGGGHPPTPVRVSMAIAKAVGRHLSSLQYSCLPAALAMAILMRPTTEKQCYDYQML